MVAGGLDIIYPPENEALYRAIAAQGVIRLAKRGHAGDAGDQLAFVFEPDERPPKRDARKMSRLVRSTANSRARVPWGRFL